MKKLLALLLAITLCCSSFLLAVSADEGKTSTPSLSCNATSAILMEYETGTVLFEQNADEKLPPASITKIMTLLLVMEALEAGKMTLEETVTASEHAASMGGSQIFLKVGEQMSVRDLLKSVVIASANDAAVALAEHLCGSTEAFVSEMNKKAAELGMQNTHFENTNGLDDTTTEHYTSARDVAIMSRALIAYPTILEFSSIWMDTIRDGAFGLTNTNRLVRFYPGATGLKTGSTAKAQFCISATAKRDGMHLIAVIMGAPTRDIRNDEAKRLLDFGFANYQLYQDSGTEFGEIPVLGGKSNVCRVKNADFSILVGKGNAVKVEKKIVMPSEIIAPIKAGEKIGEVEYTLNGEVIGQADVLASEDVERIAWWDVLLRLLRICFCVGAES